MYNEYALCYNVDYSTRFEQTGQYHRLNAHYTEWKDINNRAHLVLKVAECLLDVFMQLFKVCFNFLFSVFHWVLLITKIITTYKINVNLTVIYFLFWNVMWYQLVCHTIILSPIQNEDPSFHLNAVLKIRQCYTLSLTNSNSNFLNNCIVCI